MINAFSIDLEDYHSIVSRWWFEKEAYPTSVVVENTNYFLDVLAEFNMKATFFVLGEVAERFPELVKRINREGHELGVHGYNHFWVNTLTERVFFAEVDRARKLIQDISGQPVLGHRAPAFSIKLNMTWAFEVLLNAGFRYDSSIFPIKGKRYGDVRAGLDPFPIQVHDSTILEIPLPTLELWGRRWPVGGGGYLRHFPYWISRWAIKRINTQRPAVVYMHPYEIETLPAQPYDRIWPIQKKMHYMKFSFLQYRNRDGMKKKLKSLLMDFEFSSIMRIYDCFINTQS